MMADHERIFVKPTGESTVINEETSQAIPSDGEWVFPTKYVLRRLNDGSLVRATKSTSNKKPN